MTALVRLFRVLGTAALMLLPAARADEPYVNRDGPLTLDNFDGLHRGQFGNQGTPPDISGGVGKTGILQVVNTVAAYFPKSGTESREPWWGIPLGGAASAFPSSVAPFDPRAWYDPVAERFVMIILDGQNAAPKKSWLHLAVSKTGHPLGTPDPLNPGKRVFDPAQWHRYRYELTRPTGAFSPASPGGADYPTLAVDRRALYVTANFLEIADPAANARFTGGIEEAGVFVFDKAALYAGTGAAADGSAPPAAAPFTYFPAATDGTLQPAMPWQNPANTTLPSDAWFISLDQDAVDTFIDTHYIGYPGSGGITTDDDQTAHDDIAIPAPMAQPGGVLPLDTLGDRMMSATRHLGTIIGVFVGGYEDETQGEYPVIRLANLNPNSGTTHLLQQTYFGRGALPVIAAGPKRLCLAYTSSSATVNPGISVVMLERVEGTAELQPVSDSLLLRSATPYHGSARPGENFTRWGGHAHISTDPENHTFWICHPYARGGGQDEWGTRWFNLSSKLSGLAKFAAQIHLTTAADPIPQFGNLLPQGEIGEPLRTIKVRQGQQLFLNVAFEDVDTGSPYTGTVRWYRDGVLLQTGISWQLPINAADLSHQGRYHVTASNVADELAFSEEIFLDVIVPPVATMNTPALRLYQNLNSYLEVLPDPVLLPEMDQLTCTWNRSFGSTLLGGRVQPFSGVSTAANAAAVDGAWTCTVSNLAGSIQVSAEVIAGPRLLAQPLLPADPQVGLAPLEIGVGVTGGPDSPRPDFTGQEGASWNQDSTAGATSVVWRKDGVPIPLGGRFSTSGNASDTTWRLHISQPDYEDEGLYDCIVTDTWGAGRAVTSTPQLLILSPLAPPYLTVLQGQGPEPRTRSGMIYDSRRRRTVLFGGEAFGINPRSPFTTPMHFTSNDTWEWDGKVWVKRNPAHRPPPTSNFGMAYDSIRGRTVIFGGYQDTPPDFTPGSEVVTRDVWEWDGTDWTKITPPVSPPARLNPSMCFDSTRGEVLMLSGSNFHPEPQDTAGQYAVRKALWAWNGAQWTQRASLPNGTSPPYVGGNNAFGFDSRRGVAVLFGLFDDTEYPVWEWNGTAWNRIVPPFALRVAESRFSGSAFYDPVRRRVGLPVMGNSLSPGSNNIPAMVWWDGTGFIKGDNLALDDINGTTLTGTEGMPFGQIQDLGVFDTHRRCFVWHDTPPFINNGSASTREMHFSAKAKPVHQPVEVLFSPAQTVKIRAISAGLRPLAYQWFKDDILITDNTHYSGSATPTLTLTGTTAADAGRYTLRVTNLMNQVVTAPIRLTLQHDGLGWLVQGDARILSWPGTSGTLETSTTLAGFWTPLHGATSPYPVARDEPRRFYRVRYP